MSTRLYAEPLQLRLPPGTRSALRSLRGRGPELLQASQDQIEPERELIIIVPAPRLEMLLDVLREEREFVGWKLTQEVRGEVGQVLGQGGGTSLPQRIADDVAVEGVVGEMGHPGREACFAQPPEDGIHVAHPGGAHVGRHHQAAGPRVQDERLVSRDRARAHRRLPIASRRGQLELPDHEIDDTRENLALARDVVVQRHRLDAELLGEPAHGQRFEALLVGEANGGAQHELPAQRRSGRRSSVGLR